MGTEAEGLFRQYHSRDGGYEEVENGRLYRQYRYRAQLLCMKGDETQVENSTNELPRNLYILYRKYRISEEARIA